MSRGRQLVGMWKEADTRRVTALLVVGQQQGEAWDLLLLLLLSTPQIQNALELCSHPLKATVLWLSVIQVL